MQTETLETLATVGERTAYTGGVGSTVAFLLSSQFFGLAGVVIALVGLLVNIHYRREVNRRQVAEHNLRQAERQLRIDLMRQSGRPIPSSTDFSNLGVDE